MLYPTVADAEQGWNTERCINDWEPYPKICLFLHQTSCQAGMSECRHNFWNGFHIFCSSLLSKFLQLIQIHINIFLITNSEIIIEKKIFYDCLLSLLIEDLDNLD